MGDLDAPKRTDVPAMWAHKPEKWWEHVDACDVCSRSFARPVDDPMREHEADDRG